MTISETFKKDVECILHKTFRCDTTALVYLLVKDSSYKSEFITAGKHEEKKVKEEHVVSRLDALFEKSELINRRQ